MIIKKGDILYQYNAVDISDKDYCTKELDGINNKSCKNQDGKECINYNKCNFRAKKSELYKVRITKLEKGFEGKVCMYRYVELKYEDYKSRGAISNSSINSWAKSITEALRKHNTALKKFIITVKKSKPGEWYYIKRRELKTYESLQKRVQIKLNKIV